MRKEEYRLAMENELNRVRIREERQEIEDGNARRIQQGGIEYKLFEKKNNGEPIIEHDYFPKILEAQSNIKVVIEGLKQRQTVGQLGLCGQLILLELDIELNLLKLKNIVVGRKDIIKQENN